jgi:hypothetical protein
MALAKVEPKKTGDDWPANQKLIQLLWKSRVLQSRGISEATLSLWRSQYGGMKSEEAKLLKQSHVVLLSHFGFVATGVRQSTIN